MTFNEEKKANISILKSKLFRTPNPQCKICTTNSKRSEAKTSKIDEICPKCGLDTRFTNNIMVLKQKFFNVTDYLVFSIHQLTNSIFLRSRANT